MTIGAVARQLGLSRARVRQLDTELAPARCACGARTYDAGAVAAYVVRRAAAAAELAARRARLIEVRARRRVTSAAWRERKRREREAGQ